jgi:hypothetical protein
MIQKTGWTIKDFCVSVGISVAKFYTLPNEIAPRKVKLLGRIVIIESPEAYLARIAELQGG